MKSTFYTEAEIKAIQNALLAYKITIGRINRPAESEDKYQDICSALSKFDSKIKSAKNAPKYDPCRKFREGDKVRPVERYGRMPDDGAPVNVICEVVEDELKNGTVAIRARGNAGSVRFRVTALYLQLITPVEEMEPYRVVRPENYQCIRIMKGKRIHSSIPFDEEECVCRTLEEAKAAAEAECTRLNAACRKEQK